MNRNLMCLTVLWLLPPAVAPADERIEKAPGRQALANGSHACQAVARVVSVDPLPEPLPKDYRFRGEKIDHDPRWVVTLDVAPHKKKIPMQPGIRRYYVKTPSSLFGHEVAPDEVAGRRFRFSWTWNVRVPNKPPFEDFQAVLLDETQEIPPNVRSPAERGDESSVDLAGRWLMALPAGFTYRMTLTPAGESRYRLAPVRPRTLVFNGVYEVREKRLVMVEPDDPVEEGFAWDIRGPNALFLVAQSGKNGADYLGATLARPSEACDTPPQPESDAASVRVIRSAGKCVISEDQNGDWNRAQVAPTMTARMEYTPRFLFNPRRPYQWIGCTPLIQNPTEQTLYCSYHVALFDENGRLIGGCEQTGRVRPSAEDFQLASCIIQGPPQELLTAATYRVVVYESDQPIAARPVPADDGDESAESVFATSLSDADPTFMQHNGYRVFDSVGKIAFRKTTGEPDPAFVHFQHGAAHFRAQVWLHESVRQTWHKKDGRWDAGQKLREWTLGIVEHRVPSSRSDEYVFHAALLDDAGRLVAANTSTLGSSLMAPFNHLRNGATLQMRLYDMDDVPEGSEDRK